LLAIAYGYTLYKQSLFNWKTLFALGLVYRLLFLYSFPALSDDIYRFIWDGILVKDFIDPYAMHPNGMLDTSEFQIFLRSKMNSPDYYSVYPPFLQYLFGFTAWIGEESLLKNVLTFRLLIITAEVISFFLLRAILKRLKLSRNRAFIYFLNPLVIIELSGNLHPEAFWISFFLLSIYFLMKQNWFTSGASYALAVLVKLIPLLFAPLFLRKLKFSEFFSFFITALILSVLLLLPLIDLNTVINILDSIDLYFRNFEFNASVYYLFSWLGTAYYGYNPILSLGPILGVLSTLVLLYIQLRKGSREWGEYFKRMLFSLSIYYLFALVVHPWYLTPLVALACFRSYLFPLLWTILVFFSYHRYAEGVSHESFSYLLMEYLPVYGLLFFEMLRGESNSLSSIKQKVFNLTVKT
jgi:hypothetical protein